MMKRANVLPALLIAAGVIGGTVLSLITESAGWLVMSGPLLLSLAVLGSNVLQHRLEGVPSGRFRQTLTLAASVLLASTLVAWNAPESVAIMLPILGGGVVIPFATGPCGTPTTCVPGV